VPHTHTAVQPVPGAVVLIFFLMYQVVLICFLIANDFFIFHSLLKKLLEKLSDFLEPFAKHKETRMIEFNHVTRGCYSNRQTILVILCYCAISSVGLPAVQQRGSKQREPLCVFHGKQRRGQEGEKFSVVQFLW